MSREIDELREQIAELRLQISGIPVTFPIGGGGSAAPEIGLCIITTIGEGDVCSMQGQLVNITDIDNGEFEAVGEEVTFYPHMSSSAQNYLPWIAPPVVAFYFKVKGKRFVPMMFPNAPIFPEPTHVQSSEC